MGGEQGCQEGLGGKLSNSHALMPSGTDHLCPKLQEQL